MAAPGKARAASRPARGIRAAGRFFYRHRSLTPIPLVLLLLVYARPTTLSLSLGLPASALGETLRLAALRHIGGASRSTRIGAARLVDTGPYGVIRNPLYAGNLLLSGGLAVASGVPWLPPRLLLLFAVQYAAIVAAEEEEMARRFPEAWPAYARRVPRLLPRTIRGGTGGEPGGWGEAALVERRSLTSAGLLLAYLLFRFFRGRALP